MLPAMKKEVVPLQLQLPCEEHAQRNGTKHDRDFLESTSRAININQHTLANPPSGRGSTSLPHSKHSHDNNTNSNSNNRNNYETDNINHQLPRLGSTNQNVGIVFESKYDHLKGKHVVQVSSKRFNHGQNIVNKTIRQLFAHTESVRNKSQSNKCKLTSINHNRKRNELVNGLQFDDSYDDYDQDSNHINHK